MTEILKFPGRKNTTPIDSENFVKEFGRIYSTEPDGSAKNVNVSDTIHVTTTLEGIKTVPDIATGGNRNPRWGISFSVAVTPHLDKAQIGPLMLPTMDSKYYTSDDLAAIRDRIVFELDKTIALAKLAVDNPEAYKEFERAQLNQYNNVSNAGN